MKSHKMLSNYIMLLEPISDVFALAFCRNLESCKHLCKFRLRLSDNDLANKSDKSSDG